MGHAAVLLCDGYIESLGSREKPDKRWRGNKVCHDFIGPRFTETMINRTLILENTLILCDIGLILVSAQFVIHMTNNVKSSK